MFRLIIRNGWIIWLIRHIFSICMLIREIKIKLNKYVLPVLIAGIVLICNTVPVFASADYETTETSCTSFSMYLGTSTSQIIYADSYDDYMIPVYASFGLDATEGQRISGMLDVNLANSFSFTVSDGGVSALTFESVHGDGYSVRYNVNNPTFAHVYFDNYVYATGGVPIGYLHMSISSTLESVVVNNVIHTTAGTVNSRTYMLKSNYDTYFTEAMGYVLNNCTELDEIADYLYHISYDSAYLNDILTYLQTELPLIYSTVTNMYTRLGYVNDSVTAILNILNDIDDTLDTISWNDASNYVTFNGASSDGSTWADSILNSSTIYLSFTFNYITSESILLKIYTKLYNYGSQYRNDISLTGVYRSSISNSNVLDTFEYYFTNSSYLSNTLLYIDGIRQGTYIFEFTSDYPLSFNSTTLNLFYISSSDIEYWQILNAIENDKIAGILSDQYEAEKEAAESAVAEVDEKLDNLAQDISVVKPSNVANIADDYVNQIDTTYYQNTFSWVNNSTILLMLCLVLSMAIISYMLFGGQ